MQVLTIKNKVMKKIKTIFKNQKIQKLQLIRGGGTTDDGGTIDKNKIKTRDR